MRKKRGSLLGMYGFLKLTSYALLISVFFGCVSAATLFSVDDGWCSNDDAYATCTDKITFSTGSALDSRFTFNASSFVDTYCIQLDSGLARSASYDVSGTVIRNLHAFEYYPLGADSYIQEIGGDSDTCRFYYWSNKDCTGDVNDTEWLSSSTDYAAAGCTPDVIGSVDEGLTSTFSGAWGSIDVTCIDAITTKYLKCQGKTDVDLSDCIDDSLNDINGGDTDKLYETCNGNTDTGYDTTSDCDVDDPANNWEISLFDENHLTPLRDAIWSSGVPNASFSLIAYDLCGTGSFDRSVVASFTLTQFQTKQRVKDGTYAYNATGYVQGYMPWYGQGDYVNSSYVYGANTCSVGTVSSTSDSTDNNDFDLDSGACSVSGTCYDGVRNQDETDKDYGGACGNCSSDGKNSDVYWSVAVENQHQGFFGASNPFNATQYCVESEKSVNFLAIIISLAALGVLVFALAVFFVFAGGVGAAVIPFINSLFKRKLKKNNLNTSKDR